MTGRSETIKPLHSQRSGDWSGVRRPVVLLHGLGSSSQDWLLQRPALADWPTLALDLPGHGQSAPIGYGTRMRDLATAVAGTLKLHSEMPAHLVGISLGAAVALQLALDYPARAASLVLVNGFARLRPAPTGLLTGAVRFLLLLSGRMDLLGRWVARLLFPGPDQADLRQLAAERIGANERRSYLATMLAVARMDLRSALPRLQLPTLVVAAEQDSVVPMAAKLQLAAAIPNAELLRLTESGHATTIDRAQEFNQALLAFLEKVESRRPAPQTN